MHHRCGGGGRARRIGLDTYQGGYEQSPILATCFLLLGLAAVGFPGTLGFVSQELLLDGTMHVYPHVGILAALTTTLNGITVMRSYFHLFCGARTRYAPSQSMRPRERVALLGLLGVILIMGWMPQHFVESRWRAAQAILNARGPEI